MRSFSAAENDRLLPDFGWTSTDDTFWKENYRIWMAALKEFEKRGGLMGQVTLTTGVLNSVAAEEDFSRLNDALEALRSE